MGHKITALSAQKRNPNRVNVFLDGEFAFGLSRLVAAWLQVGQELDEVKIASLKTQETHEAAFQRALLYLNVRERSSNELRQHLHQHGMEEDVIQAVMERLERSGLVDDQRFARSWVENRQEFRPRSRRALAYELRQRGVTGEAAEQALVSTDDGEAAWQAAQKHCRKLRSLEWPEYRQKMLAFLARRGFSYETAAQAAHRSWDDLHAAGE